MYVPTVVFIASIACGTRVPVPGVLLYIHIWELHKNAYLYHSEASVLF